MEIFKYLKKRKEYDTKAYDPHINVIDKDILDSFKIIQSQDIYVKLVDHSIFKKKQYLSLFKKKIFIDLTSF